MNVKLIEGTLEVAEEVACHTFANLKSTFTPRSFSPLSVTCGSWDTNAKLNFDLVTYVLCLKQVRPIFFFSLMQLLTTQWWVKYILIKRVQNMVIETKVTVAKRES